MMRSRRIILVNERQSSAASSLDDRALLLPQNANESDYAYPLPGMILSDKRDNDSFSSAENPYGNPYDLSARFNPSMAIIIVVLLSAFFFMGFFSIYVRRCTSEEENQGGNSRRGGGGNRRMNRAPQGLDRTLIESFPVFSYSLVKGLKKGKESLECAVCLSEFEDDETLRLLPKCGHAFHPDCIDMWLFSHTTCPLCRSSLLPDSTAAEEGLMVNIEGQAHQDPLQAAEQVVIVVGPGNPEQDRVDQQGRGLNELNPFDAGVPVTSSGRASGVHNEPSSSGSPILGLVNGLRPLENRSKNFRRSHSTGHSLVRLRGNPEHPSELYISTDDRYVLDFTEGLIGSSAKAGLHRSSSCAAFCHSGSKEFSNLGFSDDTERLWRYPSSTESTRVLEAYAHFYHQPGIVTETETDRELARLSETRFDPRIKSDRWSMSVHSPVFLRTFSDSRAPYFQQQQAPIFSTSHEIMQQDRKAYLQYVKKSFKWLRGRDKRMSSNNMQGASRVSSRNAEQGGSLAYVLTVR